jgi:hypothetical protein
MRSVFVLLMIASLGASVVEAGSGLLGKLRPRYYDRRIELRLGPRKVPVRSEFMAAYSDDTLSFLKTRGLLDGYQGPALEDDEVLDRRSAAFLVGKLAAFVEARRGRVFPEELEYVTHVVVEPDMWGHRQVDLALSTGLMRPYSVRDWWNRPLSRFELASIAARAIDGLAARLRIFRYFDGEPSAHYRDLHALPSLAYGDLARALKTGVVEGVSEELFGGKDAVRGREMARTLRRLAVIALAYDPLGV